MCRESERSMHEELQPAAQNAAPIPALSYASPGTARKRSAGATRIVWVTLLGIVGIGVIGLGVVFAIVMLSIW